MNLRHTGKYRVQEKTRQQEYSVKVILEGCEDFDTSNIKHKVIRKVAEEQDPNQGEINYLDIRSQNKLSY